MGKLYPAFTSLDPGLTRDRIVFYRRYRIQVQIQSKTPSLHSRDLEKLVPDSIPLISNPAPLAHSRHDTVMGNRRWPEYNDRRWSSYGSRPMAQGNPMQPMHLFQSVPGPASAPPSHPFTNFGATIHEDPFQDLGSPATPGTVSHAEN